MISLAVNANNDIFVGPDGNLAVSDGLDALLQSCQHIMRAVLAEMILAQDRGLPYEQTVWVGVPNLRAFEAAARRALLAKEGVLHVESFSARVSQGALLYSATLRTIYGLGRIGGQ